MSRSGFLFLEVVNMEDSSLVLGKSKEKKAFSKGRLLSSPTQIWKSKISWRVAAAVFMTILLIQTCILNFSTMKNYESDALRELRAIGSSTILPLVDIRMQEMLVSPLDDQKVSRMLGLTKVVGVTVYGLGLSGDSLALIESYGEAPVTTLYDQNNTNKTYYSADGSRYEFVVPSGIGGYFMVMRMDSSAVQEGLFEFVKQTIIIMMLMSMFVTTVLMIALGHWLLEPILFLRNNLLAAVRDPEHPELEESPFDPNDEIGGAIEVAHKLIRQNADNLTRIKSAAEDKIHKLAYYDTLTGLPNRILFIQTLSEMARKGEDASIGQKGRPTCWTCNASMPTWLRIAGSAK